jgi:hypothetical protein
MQWLETSTFHNILNIIEISTSMEPNKCTH